MTSVPRRPLNEAVTRFWSFAAPAYNLPLLQHWTYRPAQDEVVAVLRDHESRTILDVACGTGILADRIQRELDTEAVYGVDMSEGMLAQAQTRSSAVHWQQSPAEQLPFDDEALDAVVTTSAFHFFDQPAALREFHRVLRSGGVAAVTTIQPPQPFTLPPFLDNDRVLAYNPPPRELQELFTAAGFTDVQQRRVRRPIWTQWMMSDLLTVGVK